MQPGAAGLVIGDRGVHSNEISSPELASRLRLGLAELLAAFDYALAAKRDVWDFAVEIAILSANGLTASDFRWLICMGYVEHAREVTRLEENGRVFRPLGSLSFAKRTCFILTERGAKMARANSGSANSGFAIANSARELVDIREMTRAEERPNLPRDHEFPTSGERPAIRTNGRACRETPTWDKDRHELRVSGKLVKHFRWPAANQETILAAFDEEGWPARIDDPLPPLPEQDSKRRLHDAIKCLNKNQQHQLIHFHGDGTGEGITWKLSIDEQSDAT